ncbi:MAG: hypothetical protein ACE5GW_12765, partial [Planctomycetota bacterium]
KKGAKKASLRPASGISAAAPLTPAGKKGDDCCPAAPPPDCSVPCDAAPAGKPAASGSGSCSGQGSSHKGAARPAETGSGTRLKKVEEKIGPDDSVTML